MINQLRQFSFLVLSLIFLSNSQAQEYNWGNVAIGGGGFVSAIITSKTEQNLVYARTDVGGAYRWDESAKRWTPLNDNVSDDETTYLGIESLAIDPQNPSRVYLLAGISYFNGGKTAILKSNDYGNTFQEIQVTNQFRAHGNGMGRQTGEKLIVDPNNSNILYCGTRWNGLFKSTNAGLTWSRLGGLNVTTTPNENGVSFVVTDPKSVNGGSSQNLFVGISRYGSNFYKSTNGGSSFTEVTGGPNTNNLMPQRAVLASDGNLYITYANGAGPHGHWDGNLNEPMDQGQVWKYNTSNGNWSNITPPSTRAFSGISVDPNNPNRLVTSTINQYASQYQWQGSTVWGDRIYTSTNGGSSWTDVINGSMGLNTNGVTWIGGHSIHWAGSVEFDPFNSNRVWVTSGNGVFRTENISNIPSTWVVQVNGFEETVPLDIVSIPNGPLVSVIGDYDGFVHDDVTKYAPIHTPRMGTTTGLDYAEQNSNVLLRVGEKMYYSTDKAKTWKECTINGTKGRVAVSANGTVFLHTPEGSSTTYRSTNNGASWSTVSGLTINGAKPTSDPMNANKFYAYGNGNMYVSTNGGANFSAAASLGNGGSNIIRLAPGREGDIWVAMYSGGLKRSTNSGSSFSTINGVSYCTAVGFGKEAPGTSYPAVYIWGTVGGVRGIYRSIDQGSNWIRINDNNHQYGGPGNGQFVIGDMNEYGRVYMSTAGRGIVTGSISSSIPLDCHGDENGSATLDNCGTCSGGNTGVEACTQDCAGEWGGTKIIDDCGVCGGSNACADCNGDLFGNAFLDNCGVCVGGNSVNQTCVGSLEAEEACTFDGVLLESTNAGFSGEGYVNTTNATGAHVSWVLNSDLTQTVTLSFRYANGGTTSRDGIITINGTSAGALALPSTGAWTTWETVSVNLNVTQGSNNVVVTATTADGLANIDLISFSEGVSNANCLITKSTHQLTSGLEIYPNPVHDKVYWTNDIKWEIINVLGELERKGSGREANLSGLSNGVYFLKRDNTIVRLVKQ